MAGARNLSAAVRRWSKTGFVPWDESGPFGMAQTGIPFGQIAAVRDWLGIRATVDRPRKEHPKLADPWIRLSSERSQRRTVMGDVRQPLRKTGEVLRGTSGDELLPARISRRDRPKSNTGQAAAGRAKGAFRLVRRTSPESCSNPETRMDYRRRRFRHQTRS